MLAWETILEDYVESAGSRAAAESLAFRIALPPEARREIETVLRLADRLADATRSAQPPAGAAERLCDRLILSGPPEVRPNWAREGEKFVAPDGTAPPGAEDDAVNAAIEGVADMADPMSTPDAGDPLGQVGERHPYLSAFNKIDAAVQREASPAQWVPLGAVDRLRTTLAEARQRGEGGASPVVAARILAQLRGEAIVPQAAVRPPDVLAAGKETEESGEPPADPDEPQA